VSPASPLAFQVLGAPARLQDPRALWLLGAVAALAALAAWRLAGRRALLGRVAGAQAARLAPTASAARPAARAGSALLGLALLALALARPQCGTRAELAKRYGVDLVIALDVSRSMRARDVAPDRLGRALLEVGELVDSLAGDRVGLVVFAGEAFVQCPLTTDYAAARLFLRAVTPESVPQQGSDVGNALQAARQVLEGSEQGGGRSKVVLLVSDGEDLEGEARRAAAQLGEAGIRVHALAVGTAAGEPVPLLGPDGEVRGYRKDRSGQPVVTRLDRATLEAVTGAASGEVFEIGSADHGPAALRAALATLEKGELTSRLTVEYEDRFAYAAWPALALLLLALLLPEGRRPARRDEEAAA